jgi:hypothetical protein
LNIDFPIVSTASARLLRGTVISAAGFEVYRRETYKWELESRIALKSRIVVWRGLMPLELPAHDGTSQTLFLISAMAHDLK